MLLDASQDDSYTPRKVVVLAGSTARHLRPVGPSLVLAERSRSPSGWVVLPVGEDGGGATAFVVRLLVLENNMGGRDTRIRALKFMGPRSADAAQHEDHKNQQRLRQQQQQQAILFGQMR